MLRCLRIQPRRLAWCMQHYERLSVWKKAHEFALRVHGDTEQLLSGPHRNIAYQLRRAATSIALNIVEGSGRASSPQFAYFLTVAVGSSRECCYLLRLAADLGCLEVTRRA